MPTTMLIGPDVLSLAGEALLLLLTLPGKPSAFEPELGYLAEQPLLL